MATPTPGSRRPRARRAQDRPLKVAYLAGPIDADHVRDCWTAGVEDETYYGTRYLTQFYEVCARRGLVSHVVAPTDERRRSRHDDIDYWRVPLARRSGALYHLGQVVHLLRFAARAVALRADAVVVVPSPPYWFVLHVLRPFGIVVIPSAHRVLWTRLRTPTRAQSLLLRLTSSFFVRGCGPVLAVSDEIAAQIVTLTRGRKPRTDILEFRPTYDPARFPTSAPLDGPPAPGAGTPFRVLFVGRVERDKGIFLLLEVAAQLAASGRGDVVFDVCGTGSALPDVDEAIGAAGLEGTVITHGHCDKATLRSRYERCHVVVVPTTTDFVEGFNKVVAEAVLAGKPVITSEVCPALHVVEDAVVVVPPDEAGPYADAIELLRGDDDLYRAKQRACARLRGQFLDADRGWGHHFEEAMLRLSLVPAT